MAATIEVRDLSHTYSAGTPFQHDAVKHMSFSVEKGEFLGIIGHTGSGKSTLIQHLNGLLRPTSGEILLDGTNIWQDKKTTRESRFRVGLVFQYPEYQLFEETVYRDIAFGPKNMGLSEEEIRTRVLRAAGFAGVDESLLEKSPFDLSGGQKRRVAIAGVIAMEPEERSRCPARRARCSPMRRVWRRLACPCRRLRRCSCACGSWAWTLTRRPLPWSRLCRSSARCWRAVPMLKDITLGQYFPGDTVVHRLDPRTKLLMVIVYIVALFLAKWVVSYAVMLAFLVTAVALSRIRPRALFKGLKPLLFIIIFTAIINVFYTKGDVLVQFWIFKITREGLVNAGFLVLRIVMLVTGTFLLTYTTSPIALTDGLESLLSPLKAIHFPVHELALMMSIALRFIPTLIEETDKIISAQKARGADFETGNLFHRAKALVPILVPLFISAFRRADELATAMECRCYRGGSGRTKLKQLRFQLRDILTFALGAAVLAGVIVLRSYGL